MTTLAPPEALLAQLVAHPGGLSAARAAEWLGEDLAAAAGTLRARGHDLRRDGAAWRLECATRHFDPAAFESARQGSWGAPCEVWESARSTNDLARDGAVRGAPEGALWCAEQQSAGRGRQGRGWVCAPHAGILASWVLRESWTRALHPSLLPLVVGLGICEALRALSALDVRPKWPNDLWLGGAKLGGILVEARPGGAGFAVVGLGLNVLADPGREAAAGIRTTSLHDHLPGPRRETLLAAALAGCERRVREWRAGDPAPLLASYQDLDLTQGRVVRVESGGEVARGRVVGIGAEGSLQVTTEDGRAHEFVAGEVHLL
jgi:BirA family transcriptional regulator, biotin operon repressor / biotin---[acetyl-CoA-carboxylase] ligase